MPASRVPLKKRRQDHWLGVLGEGQQVEVALNLGVADPHSDEVEATAP